MSAFNTQRDTPPRRGAPSVGAASRDRDEAPISRFPSEYTSDDNIVRHSLTDPEGMLVEREHDLAERAKHPDPVFRNVKAKSVVPRPTPPPRDFPTPEELTRDARLMGDVQAPNEEDTPAAT